MGPALSLAEATQLLWSAQGENRPGRRTVPSAHARYPLGLGSGVASGVDLAAIGASLGLPSEEKVLVLLPVGRRKPGP